MQYDINYFISKTENLSEEAFCTLDFENEQGQKCINGQCGVSSFSDLTEESKALVPLFNLLPPRFCIHTNLLIPINDGDYSYRAAMINNGECIKYQQPTVKGRLLAALYDIKQILAVKEAQSIIAGPKEPEESDCNTDNWDNSGLGQLQPEWLPDEEECEYEEEEDLFEDHTQGG